MDLSPQTIRDIEFREKLRGYNQDEVDEFLERVAAGVEILQERLRQATDRAVRAEQQAKEVYDDDDSLRRTLGLAQRTADLAVQEAREQAARIIQAAEAEAAAMAEEAQEAARRLADEAQSHIWADVGRLESGRENLRQDVVALAQYLDAERARAEASLIDAAQHLRGLVPGASPPPSLHQIDLSALRSWGRPRSSSASGLVDDDTADDLADDVADDDGPMSQTASLPVFDDAAQSPSQHPF